MNYQPNINKQELKRLGEGERLSSCKHTLAAAAAFAAAALASV
jgi:hypothetical protein